MKKEIILIKDVLKNVINSYEYKNGLKISLLCTHWKDIIGEKLFIHTRPDKILKKVLFIKCSHTGWISTLQFYKKDIMKNIEKIFPDDFNINDITFIYGKIEKNENENDDKIEINSNLNKNKDNEIYEELLKKLNYPHNKNG